GGTGAEGGPRKEGGEANAAQGRDKMAQPEREDWHEPQEQQIAERVGAKSASKLAGQRSRPAQQVLADRALGDQENEDRANGGADKGRDPAEHGPEQDPADQGEKQPHRNRQGDYDDIKRNIGRHGGDVVHRNELPQGI